MMKLYLASRYARRAELLDYARQIEAAGHEVTSRWVRGEHSADTEDELACSSARFAQEDIDDIKASHVFLAFTEAPGAIPGRSRGGRHVELGIALMLDKKIIIVGPPENIFCCLPDILHYPDWETFKTRWLAESVRYERQIKSSGN